MSGWIKLYRQILESDGWVDTAFDEQRAWIDLLLCAAHEPIEREAGGKAVTLRPGQLIASQRYLADRWKWDRSRVRRFMKRMSNPDDPRLSTCDKNGVNIVTILKWNKYQTESKNYGFSLDPPNDPPSDPPFDPPMPVVNTDKTSASGDGVLQNDPPFDPPSDPPNDPNTRRRKKKKEEYKLAALALRACEQFAAIGDEELAKWSTRYNLADADLAHEIENAGDWLANASPSRQPKSAKRFLTNWLRRAGGDAATTSESSDPFTCELPSRDEALALLRDCGAIE